MASIQQQIDDTLKLSLQTEIDGHMGRGVRLFDQGKFEESIAALSQGCLLTEQVYGPMSLVTADCFFKYGLALLENGIRQSSLSAAKRLEAKEEREKKKATESTQAPVPSSSAPDALTKEFFASVPSVNNGTKKSLEYAVTVENEASDSENDEPNLSHEAWELNQMKLNEYNHALAEEEMQRLQQEEGRAGKIFYFASDRDLEEDFISNDVNGEGFANPLPEIANQEQENKENDDDDDFDLAWSIFETARCIYENAIRELSNKIEDRTVKDKSDQDRLKELQIKLGEIFTNLGIVALESESFELAVGEYQKAIQTREACLDPIDRRIASSYYQKAVGLEFLNKVDGAKQALNKVIEILKARLEILDSDKDTEEIAEIKELLIEVNSKLSDLNVPAPKVTTEMIREFFGDFELQGPQENATNINSLVKRKANPEDNSAAKKPRDA